LKEDRVEMNMKFSEETFGGVGKGEKKQGVDTKKEKV